MKLIVEQSDAGQRLDVYVSSRLDTISRSCAQQLVLGGNILVNGDKQSSKKYKVKTSDEIEVDIPEPEENSVEPEDIALDIVYEDDDVLVVDKPRGMVVHPGAGTANGTLVNALLNYCGDSLSSINDSDRPGIVHRIDKDTSGLLMVAKNNNAHESLAAQLKNHSCRREYTALVYDNIVEDDITIDKPIGRDERNRLRRAVNGSAPRDAVTHIHVIKRYGKYTLVKARLETGRTHQIRVHMAYISHPLVGDLLYGPRKQKFVKDGQLLHAGVLGFIHPTSGEYMEFESPLPKYFTDVLDKLNRMFPNQIEAQEEYQSEN